MKKRLTISSADFDMLDELIKKHGGVKLLYNINTKRSTKIRDLEDEVARLQQIIKDNNKCFICQLLQRWK